MTSSDENKSAVRDCYENASQGDFDALHEVVSAGYVLHPEGIRGVEGLSEMVKGYRSAPADLTVTVEHQFTEGRRAAVSAVERAAAPLDN